MRLEHFYTWDQSVSYLPIMVECCCTAASSSLSRMVHSPMVMDWWQRAHRKRDSFFRFSPRLSGPNRGTPPPSPSSFSDLYSLAWPLISVLVSSSGTVLLCIPFLDAELTANPLPPPSTTSVCPRPPPHHHLLHHLLHSAVMLVLPPLQQRSALRYSICYSSLYDSHDHPLTVPLSSLCPLAVLSPPLSFCPPLPLGHSLYFSCTLGHRCRSALVLPLCIFVFAAPLLL